MRLPRLRAFLERRQPDIVCLQETKVPDEQFPGHALRPLGYHVLVSGEKTYNGVAVLSRAPGTDTITALPGDDPQRRLLVTSVEGLRVVNVYAPNGTAVGTDKYAYKLDWYRRLREYLDGALDPGREVILCGDLNIAPEERDVWDPEQWRDRVMFSEPEREQFRALLQWGFADSLRLHRPDEGGLYTWWDYRAGAFHRGWGLRIDHILLSAPLARRCAEVEIDRNERKGTLPSDHAPVVATLT